MIDLSFCVLPLVTSILFGYFVHWIFGNRSRYPKLRNGFSFDRQSLPVKNQPGVFKSALLTDNDVSTLETFFDDVITLYDAFQRGLRLAPQGRCLGRRIENGYRFSTYSEVDENSKAMAATMHRWAGLERGCRVGIYGKNCPGWFESALAATRLSVTVVPLYDTLGSEAAAFVLNQTEISLVVVDSVARLRKLLENKDNVPTLTHVIVIENNIEESDKQTAEQLGVSVMSYSEAMDYGRSNPVDDEPPTKDDVYIICYTSGTTGQPKGVVLTHRNLVANLSGWVKILDTFKPDVLNESQVLISYLPLSHMMEQMTHWTMMMIGGSIGYFRGDVQGLMDDIRCLRPTIFPVVPRLLNRLYDSIQTKLLSSNWLARLLFQVAYAQKKKLFEQGIITKNTIWDRLVFSKIQAQLGGRVMNMATGSAPISAPVLEMARIALGANIVEGYGQTECTALVTCTWPGEWRGGHCGGPAPSTVIRMADVPEMNYFANMGTGEILVKGPAVTSGYYRNPTETALLFDSEGFLRTGDIGRMNIDGTISIIDRKKHIFKLAQGEYVAPEKIENAYSRAPVVQHIFVDGNSTERWLIAVVVPNEVVLADWNHHHGHNGRTMEETIEDPQVHDYVLSELLTLGKEGKLNSLEQVRRVHLTLTAFSVENGLLTPTMKAKRNELRRTFQKDLDRIYIEYAHLK